MISKWFDKITGKEGLKREYIERINEIHDENCKLREHFLKIYPMSRISKGFYDGCTGMLASKTAILNNHIFGIISGDIKQNPKMQYPEEEAIKLEYL